jgi:sodium-dependent phosphate transporter
VAIFVGVPLIKRQVQRDWEELSKPEAIPELKGAVPASAGDAKVSQLGPGV